MGVSCTKPQALTQDEKNERAQDSFIQKQLEVEAKKEEKVQKLLLLGAGESGKSTIFKQIKVLFQTGFDEAERMSFVPVIHANVFQSIRTLIIGCKDFAESSEGDPSKYVLQPENQTFAEVLAEIENPDGFPPLDEVCALKLQSCWRDPAVQAALSRGNEIQLPDCTAFFLENVSRFAEWGYIPTQEDILYARQQTTGIAEIEFSPTKESKKSSGPYKVFDVGGQRNERKKWIHLFDGVTAIIFCASLSEYDQMLYEDNKKNRMMETKELFEWLLKQPWFENTSFLVFLNKFDIFKQKASTVPLSVCEWFRDYETSTSSGQEIEHAYEFVQRKFQEIYDQNTPSDSINRVCRIYKTTAIDRDLIKKTFGLVDEMLTLRRLEKEGLL